MLDSCRPELIGLAVRSPDRRLQPSWRTKGPVMASCLRLASAVASICPKKKIRYQRRPQLSRTPSRILYMIECIECPRLVISPKHPAIKHPLISSSILKQVILISTHITTSPAVFSPEMEGERYTGGKLVLDSRSGLPLVTRTSRSRMRPTANNPRTWCAALSLASRQSYSEGIEGREGHSSACARDPENRLLPMQPAQVLTSNDPDQNDLRLR